MEGARTRRASKQIYIEWVTLNAVITFLLEETQCSLHLVSLLQEELQSLTNSILPSLFIKIKTKTKQKLTGVLLASGLPKSNYNVFTTGYKVIYVSHYYNMNITLQRGNDLCIFSILDFLLSSLLAFLRVILFFYCGYRCISLSSCLFIC